MMVVTGDLGAGKTAFVQGFGRALGVTDRITSPTFTLVHVYEGRLPIHHLDVYRLEQLEEAADLDLPEMLRSEEHTSELQSLMRTSYAVFCLQKKTNTSD